MAGVTGAPKFFQLVVLWYNGGHCRRENSKTRRHSEEEGRGARARHTGALPQIKLDTEEQDPATAHDSKNPSPQASETLQKFFWPVTLCHSTFSLYGVWRVLHGLCSFGGAK